MFNTTELKKIWTGKTFHWSTKVRLLERYHNTQKSENLSWSEDKTAYALNISQPSVWQGLRLAAMIRKFPTLAKIPNKWDVVDLIQAHSGRPVSELRKIIKVISIKYKSNEHYNRLRRELITEGIDPDDTIERDDDRREKIEFIDTVAGES